MVTHSYSQTKVAGKKKILKAGTTVRKKFVPPDANLASKTATSLFIINFIGSEWSNNPSAKNAFEYAANIWSKTITSSVPIRIDARFYNFGNTDLGQAGPTSVRRDFSTNDPKFKASTFYSLALANKMAGSDLDPNDQDIDAAFNSSQSWYFGTDGNCPTDKYDFVGSVLHEIAHGLDFYSSDNIDISGSITGTPNTLYWSENGYPQIYDWYVVNSSGTRLTSFPLFSSALTTFLQSDDIFFDGNEAALANGLMNVKLYAPNAYKVGSSISHLDEATFSPPSTSAPNALMTPQRELGESIHNPGPVGIGILNDIGWEAVLWIGLEDRVDLYANSPTVLDVGTSYIYNIVFTDVEPYGDYLVTRDWKLEVLHENGKHLLHSSTNNNNSWNFTLSNLPTNKTWLRNYFTGRVRALVTVVGTDNDGVPHKDELPIEINYAPDEPEVAVRNVTQIINAGANAGCDDCPVFYDTLNCARAEVSFFAYGATSYSVDYCEDFGDYTDNCQSVTVPSGTNSVIINGLNQSKNYFIFVVAHNSTGNSGNNGYRERCVPPAVSKPDYPKGVIAVPNPAYDIVRLVMQQERRKILRVELRKIDNPNEGRDVIVNPPRKEVEIPIGQFTPGYYGAKVMADDNQTYSVIFLKQ